MITALRRRVWPRGEPEHESSGPLAVVRRVADDACTLGARDGARLLRDAFAENDLLTSASAISFQIVFALIPLTLFTLGLLGGSGLESVWTNDAAPAVRDAVGPPAFQVIDDTVRQILSTRQAFWITAGAALAIWEVSGAVRAVMGLLNRVYDSPRTRSFLRHMAVSIGLAIAVTLLLLVTGATVQLAPRLIDGGVAGPVVDVLHWPLALVLLWSAVTLVVRTAPAHERPPGRVTFGSTLVVIAWLVSSAAFGWYVTHLADYGSIFGALATFVILLSYIYISSIAFVTGVQIDALVQQLRSDS